jgi:prepilin-type processing-associated H-X9-DG protein
LWNLAFEAQRLDPVGNASVHETVMAHKVGLFLCPTVTMESGGYGNGITWGLTSYLGVAGTNVHANDGVFHRNYTVRFADITDGTSNTLMIGERPPGPQGIFSGWYAAWGDSVCLLAQILPAGSNEWLPIQAISCEVTIGTFRPGQVDDACDINHFWSTHRGGANFAFADGSVHFLTYGNSDLMAALATRAGGEAVQPLD